MKMYIDLIILINFFFDFLLLIAVSLMLKRKVKLYRIILGALIGAVSIISLLINFNSITLFLFKVIISIIMILITFSFKNIKYTFDNLLYLYLVSIILGGFLYFVNNSFSYKNKGLIFFHNGFSINIILIIILTPIFIYFYIKNLNKLKEKNTLNYSVEITFLNNKKINVTGFLDTGNELIDPYKKRPIIVINKELLNGYKPKCILVPCITVNKEEMLKCFRIKNLIINNKKINKECLVAISNNNFNKLNVDLLLHKKIIKEIEDEKIN